MTEGLPGVAGSVSRTPGRGVRCVITRFTAAHRGGAGAPLVCVHGFMDTWRTWELVLPQLERRHDVLAPTLLGHAGGPPLEGAVDDAVVADASASSDASARLTVDAAARRSTCSQRRKSRAA